MPLATREELLRPVKRRFRELTLPVSGCTVRIRSLTQLEREQYEVSTLKDGKVRSDAERLLIVRCLVDESGDRLLTDEDVSLLKEWDGKDSGVLYRACTEFSAMSAYDVERTLGNSDRVADVDSESVSPKPAGDSATSTDS